MSALGDHDRRNTNPPAPPLLMIHGFTGTWRAWGPVLDLLAEQFDVLAPTVGGHTGGPDLPEDARLDDVLDGLEAMMDEAGWERAHVAGWSMGGQCALELAVRGRALSATAISPSGAWTHDTALDKEIRRINRLFKRTHTSAVRGARITARVMASPRLRAIALRDQMVNGARVRPEEGVAMTEAFAQTPIFASFVEATAANERKLEGLERIDVPVTVAWGDTDRVLPQAKHEAFFRERLPAHARFVTVKRAGHTPFWDAPERIADLIAQTALNAERRSQTA